MWNFVKRHSSGLLAWAFLILMTCLALDNLTEVSRTEGPVVITLAHARLGSAFDRTGGASPDTRPLAAAYEYLAFETEH